MSADTTNAEQQLLDVYDCIADTPDVIGRLRRFVFDLAVRGKLVAQDPDDEPASELLKQAAVEKERLVNTGEIRKPRNLSNGEELKPPFEVPASWRWCRLDTIGAIIGGGTPEAGDPTNFAAPGEGIPWLTPADLGDHRELYISAGARDLSQKGLQSSSATLMPTGTVLFTSRAPIGYVAISTNPISTNQGFKSIIPYVADCSRFIALAMQAFASKIDAKAPGTTFKEVSGKIVAGIAFPLPPLAEQHRIVAKVEELMALLDQLEAIRTFAESTRDRLAATSLNRLTAPETAPEAFPARARFALDALPSISTRPDQIQFIRQTVLNLAVRGKLIEQDPADEPADALLDRARTAKLVRMKERRISRDTAPEMSSSAGEPSAPSHWCWTHLHDFALVLGGKRLPAGAKFSEYRTGNIYIRVTNMKQGTIEGKNLKFISNDVREKIAKYTIDKDDLYITIAGTIGAVGDVPEMFDGQNLTENAAKIVFGEIYKPFLKLVLQSNDVQDQFAEKTKQMAQPKLALKRISGARVPIPPFAEQVRIVERVDELIVLCDRLETALATANTTRQRLLEALLHRTLVGHTNSRVAA